MGILKLYFVLDIIWYLADSEIGKNTQTSLWNDLNYRLSAIFSVTRNKNSTLYRDQVHTYKYLYSYKKRPQKSSGNNVNMVYTDYNFLRGFKHQLVNHGLQLEKYLLLTTYDPTFLKCTHQVATKRQIKFVELKPACILPIIVLTKIYPHYRNKRREPSAFHFCHHIEYLSFTTPHFENIRLWYKLCISQKLILFSKFIIERFV